MQVPCAQVSIDARAWGLELRNFYGCSESCTTALRYRTSCSEQAADDTRAEGERLLALQASEARAAALQRAAEELAELQHRADLEVCPRAEDFGAPEVLNT